MNINYTLPSIIKHKDDSYILLFNDLDCMKSVFQKFNIVPDGHMWERLIIDYYDNNNLNIPAIVFDSESDLLSAYSDKKDNLQKIVKVIHVLISEPETLIKLLDNLDFEDDDDDIDTPHEFIEQLKLNEVDLSSPIDVMFDITFTSLANAKNAGEICSDKGYQCYIDDRDKEVLFSAGIELIPDIDKIQSKVNFFQELANQLEGKFDYYSNYNKEDDNPVTCAFGSTWVTYETLCNKE